MSKRVAKPRRLYSVSLPEGAEHPESFGAGRAEVEEIAGDEPDI